MKEWPNVLRVVGSDLLFRMEYNGQISKLHETPETIQLCKGRSKSKSKQHYLSKLN